VHVSILGADRAEEVGVDHVFRRAEVGRIAQVLGDPGPGHRDDRVQAWVAVQDRVAGTVDTGLVGDVELNGCKPLGAAAVAR
jgi:hypothetical protein